MAEAGRRRERGGAANPVAGRKDDARSRAFLTIDGGFCQGEMRLERRCWFIRRVEIFGRSRSGEFNVVSSGGSDVDAKPRFKFVSKELLFLP